jgi:hypothetical protein
MAARFLIALVVLTIGAMMGTLMALVATNGYSTSGDLAVSGYLVLGVALVLLLSWLAAASSRALSGRLRWSGWFTLPLMLIPALLIEQIGLPILAVIMAELARALR